MYLILQYDYGTSIINGEGLTSFTNDVSHLIDELEEDALDRNGRVFLQNTDSLVLIVSVPVINTDAPLVIYARVKIFEHFMKQYNLLNTSTAFCNIIKHQSSNTTNYIFEVKVGIKDKWEKTHVVKVRRGSGKATMIDGTVLF